MGIFSHIFANKKTQQRLNNGVFNITGGRWVVRSQPHIFVFSGKRQLAYLKNNNSQLSRRSGLATNQNVSVPNTPVRKVWSNVGSI